MEHDAKSGRKHGISGKKGYRYLLYKPAGANYIYGVGYRTKKNKETAPNNGGTARSNLQFACKGKQNSGIGKGKCLSLKFGYFLFEQHEINQNGKSGIEEKDKSFKPRRYVLKPQKIEQAADVITHKPHGAYIPKLFAGNGRAGSAKGNKGGYKVKRHGQKHSQRKQAYRINRGIAECKLYKNGLG